MVLKVKFWSFPIHTYQKQPSMMIILAVRGRGKNLVIDRNSIVKNENLKILTKTQLYTSKESSEHVKCRFRLKKYDLLLKKWKKLILKKKIFKGGTL